LNHKSGENRGRRWDTAVSLIQEKKKKKGGKWKAYTATIATRIRAGRGPRLSKEIGTKKKNNYVRSKIRGPVSF